MNTIRDRLDARLQQKGDGIFMSPHEIWGVMDEEMLEFKDAVTANDMQHVYLELIDIAVAAIFGLVSIQTPGFADKEL
jgi:hypothetical protein